MVIDFRHILIVFAATAVAAMIVLFASVLGAFASEQKLKPFDDSRRVSVWIDPETKCHYLIVSAYGGNGGPNSFAITPRMVKRYSHYQGIMHWCD